MIGAVETWLSGQKENFPLFAPVLLGAGAAFYFSLFFEPGLIAVIIVWLILASCGGILFFKRQVLKHGYIFFILWSAVFLTATGFTAAKIKTELIATPIITKETRPLNVRGRIVHIETLEGSRGTLVLIGGPVIEGFTSDKTPAMIRLTSRRRIRLEPGDFIAVLAKLTPPSRPVMPGAYDFRRHYFFQGIGAMGFMLTTPNRLNTENADKISLEKIRKDIGEHIAQTIPARLSGIANALITGERAAIEDADWQALRISGLAHIISISGLHVVLIATPIFFFVRLFLALIPGWALRYPIKKIAALAALMACCFYVALVVPSVPTYRALLMTGTGLVAILIDRSPFSLRLIAFAATLILLLSPESIWSASFQLSFAAVFSLILSAQMTRSYWMAWRSQSGVLRKIILYAAVSIFTTLVVSVATAPLAVFHFQQLPLYSVFANAFATPVTGLIIMPMVILVFLLWPFGLQDPAIRIMGYGIEWMLAIAHETAAWPSSGIPVPAMPGIAVACLSLGGLILITVPGRPRMLSIPLLIAGCLIAVFHKQPAIVISQSGGLVIAITDHGAYASSLKKDRFLRQTFVKRFGLDEAEMQVFPKEGIAAPGKGKRISCGEGSCRIEQAGVKVTTGTDLYSLAKDCEWADFIVTPSVFRLRGCKAEIFDKFSLTNSGAVTLYSKDEIETVQQSLGLRPWSPVSDRSGSGLKALPESGRGRQSGSAAYRHRSLAQE